MAEPKGEFKKQMWLGESLYHAMEEEQIYFGNNSMPVTLRAIIDERNRLRQEKEKLIQMLAAKKKVRK